MKDYVADASVIIQHFVPDAYTANADALFDELGTAVMLHVPEFCLLECANVIWKQIRFQNLTQVDAETLIEDLAKLPLRIVSTAGFLKRSLQIGVMHQFAVYDSAYIAVAEQLHYPLITVDNRQEMAARSLGLTIKPLTDFHP